MNLFFPDNIFASLIAKNLKGEHDIKYLPSSLLAKKVSEDENSAALIPTTDLLQHKELFVSKKIGISFDGELSNSYIYFKPGGTDLNEIALSGDVSSLEALLSKILFKEVYNSEISLKILTDNPQFENNNLVVAGDINLSSGIFKKGLSYADELTDLLNLPFVNFVAASQSQKLIEELNEITKDISEAIYASVEKGELIGKYPAETIKFLKLHIPELIYEFDEQDVEGITQLVMLPYLHGITKELFDIKFI
ncbi:MAG: hypothetical protein K8H86_06950 [Ignavibacteriaceae bacterium]|nr:hypothetical protein [Ignavibacteriaceae bacterium]